MRKALVGTAFVAVALAIGALHHILGRGEAQDRDEPIALRNQRQNASA